MCKYPLKVWGGLCSCIFWLCFIPVALLSRGAAVKCPCRGCQRCSFSVFQANVSFKIWSKAWLRELCSLWLFSNTFVYLIVGVDRLDKDLTIGQMQGKYLILLLQPYCSALFVFVAMGTANIQTNGHERIRPSQSLLLTVVKEGWGR